MVIADQISKHIRISAASINAKAVFSISLSSSLIMLFAVCALALLSIYWRRYQDKGIRYPISLILGGGLSNGIDRILRLGVIDVFHVKGLSFNLADVAIVSGALLALIMLLHTNKKCRFQNNMLS